MTTEEKQQLLTVDICARLPYGLKYQYEGVVTSGIKFADDWKNAANTADSAIYYGKCKPILFPISCLTERFTVRGKTFTPLVKLAKVAFPAMCWDLVNATCESDDGCWFWYDYMTKSFSVDGTISNSVPNQLLLFDKLNEWMIDYRELINNKLAVSVFDLHENPYKL